MFSRKFTFPDTIDRDSVLDIGDLTTAMMERAVGKGIVNGVPIIDRKDEDEDEK